MLISTRKLALRDRWLQRVRSSRASLRHRATIAGLAGGLSLMVSSLFITRCACRTMPALSHYREFVCATVFSSRSLSCEQDAESAVRRQKERGRVSLASFTVLPMIPEDDPGEKGGKAKSNGKAHSQFSFMLTDGQKQFKLAALTEAERYSWVSQLILATDQVWAAGLTAGLPGRLSCKGTTDVQLAEWKEASRDFTRAFVHHRFSSDL